MAQRIQGDHYSIEWDEESCEWVGYVLMDRYHVRVKTDDDIEKVLLVVLHHLDDYLSETKGKTHD